MSKPTTEATKANKADVANKPNEADKAKANEADEAKANEANKAIMAKADLAANEVHEADNATVVVKADEATMPRPMKVLRPL
jgi:hypothetical protein